jgi:hypothetical protein
MFVKYNTRSRCVGSGCCPDGGDAGGYFVQGGFTPFMRA